MISETLAGTNAGVSEVSLSDTSSSNSNPPNGAIAENRAESPAEAVRASTPAGLAELSPRQGWWKESVSGPYLRDVALALKPWLPDSFAQRLRYD